MKAVLHEQAFERYDVVFEGKTEIDVSGEAIVSDKMPDIGLLCDTNAHVLLRSKRTETGAAIMEGDLSISVCYVPDGGTGFCSLKMQLPWMADFQSETISGGCFAICSVQVAHLETRVLNPRKVLVKAKLKVNIRAHAQNKTFVCDFIEGDETVQVRREHGSCSVISSVCEKTFVATDEYPLPVGLVGDEVIGKSVQFRIDDIKTLANKLIVKGSVLSDVLVASKDGMTEKLSFISSFSFITETDCEQVSDTVRTDIVPTATYYELSSNGQSLSVEVHGVCQMTVYEQREFEYLSDAYSNFYLCRCEYDSLNVYSEVKRELRRETLSGSIACRSELSSVRFLASGYTQSEERIIASVGACVEYQNGSLDWVCKHIAVPVNGNDAENITAVRINDVFSSCNGTELEFRVNMEWNSVIETGEKISFLRSTEWDENDCLAVKENSLSVVKAKGDLWDLARKYRSTVSLIQLYNGLTENEIDTDTLLLVPRQRK